MAACTQPLVDAALAMQRAVEAIDVEGGHQFRVGIGVHTGELVVGCLGSGLRMEFTVLGDTVNTASRLEGLTKQLSRPVLISGSTVESGGEHGLVRLTDVTPTGRAESVAVFVPASPATVPRPSLSQGHATLS